MQYNKLLNNFNSLPIMINPTTYYLLKNPKYKSRYLDLIRVLITDIGFDFNKQDLLYIEVTKEGLKIDFTKLKEAYAKYFNIGLDENFISSLEKIETSIEENKYSISHLTPNQLKHFKKRLREHSNGKLYSKNLEASKYLKEELAEFLTDNSSSIKLLKEIITNEEKYSLVPDIFDENKIGLYLAYMIVNHLKISEDDKEKVHNDLIYLKTYIDNNKELIEQGYIVKLFNRTPYKIAYIESIVKSYNTNDKCEKILKNYSHSFYAYDEMTTEEVFDNIYEYIITSDNSDNLKEEITSKLDFYKSLDITNIMIGIDSFDGYIGFELLEGFVLLDKLYDSSEKGIISKNNNIYIITKEEFKKINGITKEETKEAIKNGEIHVKKINYNQQTERKIKEYIKTE